MKMAVIALLVLCLLLVGCPKPVTSVPEMDGDVVFDSPPQDILDGGTIEPYGTIVRDSVPQDTLVEPSGIKPCKVEIGNFYPGARADEYPTGKPIAIEIYNGNLTPAMFSIRFNDDNSNVTDGFMVAPAEVRDWVKISSPLVEIAPKAWGIVNIALEMPEDAESPGDRWEFGILVKDMTQTGFVQVQYNCRFLVTMK